VKQSEQKIQIQNQIKAQKSNSGKKVQISGPEDKSYDLLDLSPSNRTPDSLRRSDNELPRTAFGKRQSDSLDRNYDPNQAINQPVNQPLLEYSKIINSRGDHNMPEETNYGQYIPPVAMEDRARDKKPMYNPNIAPLEESKYDTQRVNRYGFYK
jgi:hypothetical protein